MKNVFRLASVIALSSLTFIACSQKERVVDASNFKNVTDSASYVLGYSQAMAWKAQGMEINPEVFFVAFQQVYNGDTTCAISQEEMSAVMQSYQTVLMEKQMANSDKAAVPYRNAAAEFLEKNKNEKGVVTTQSGLQYRVKKKGNGASPTSIDDRVRFNYSLYALNVDGTFSEAIENTFTREGDPTISVLNGLIPGIREAFLLMQQGSIYEFWVHPDLAYGNQNSDVIPGVSLLKFRIELVEVLPAK
jgi:FKBP-type peptidyl-prolyl cis-trans isomerase